MRFRTDDFPFAILGAMLLLSAGVASAQEAVPASSLRGSLTALQGRIDTVTGGGAPEASLVELVSQLISLEVSNAPTGTSTGGFTFTFDRQLGIFRRSTQSFGPAFGKRATTIGKGKASVGYNWLHANYDSMGGMSISNGDFRTGRNIQGFGFDGGYTETRARVTSDTYVGFASFGVTDDFDIGVAVPWVHISLAVDFAFIAASGTDVTPGWPAAAGRGMLLPTTTAAGLGDIAIVGKYRVWRQGEGGLATEVEVHLPSGNTDDLRGAGVTRTLASAVWSTGGAISPHANVGYEFWSSDVRIGDVSVKDQIVYAFGVEARIHPRATLLADITGRRQLSGGKLAYRTIQLDPVRSFDVLVAVPGDLDVVSFAPGIKWNVGGNVLLTGNVLAAIANRGLRANVIPVVGLEWAF